MSPALCAGLHSVAHFVGSAGQASAGAIRAYRVAVRRYIVDLISQPALTTCANQLTAFVVLILKSFVPSRRDSVALAITSSSDFMIYDRPRLSLPTPAQIPSPTPTNGVS